MVATPYMQEEFIPHVYDIRCTLIIYTDYMCIYIYTYQLPNLDSEMPRLLPVAQLFAEFHRICVGRPAPEALSQLQSSLPV